jgi:CheY-like chemotaxis protein
MPADCSILIVEDDPDDIFLLRRALRTAGGVVGRAAQIATANNGREAMSLLGRLVARNELPRVVTVDLNMPVMNGIEFLKSVRGTPSLAGLKTVVVTTSVEREIHAEARNAGADEIFAKPQTESDFNLIAEHLLRNCPV